MAIYLLFPLSASAETVPGASRSLTCLPFRKFQIST
jgi:hypothetical protein